MKVLNPLTEQCSHHIETRQLNGFYIMGTLVVKGIKVFFVCLSSCGLQYDVEHSAFFLSILQMLLICSSNFSYESKVIPSNLSLRLNVADVKANLPSRI